MRVTIEREAHDRANAALIAAAPEMYEALQFVESLTAEAHGDAGVGTGEEVALRHTLRRVQAALAKARGEEVRS